MRRETNCLGMVRLLAAAALLTGCSSEDVAPAADAGGGDQEVSRPDHEVTLEPRTDAGGLPADGTVVGDVRVPTDTQIPDGFACQPTTCQLKGAGCGTISDGCGKTLTCGGCPNAADTCVAGKCISSACGALPVNACGGCETLPMQPGGTCGCKHTAKCNGLLYVECDDGNDDLKPAALPDTADDMSGWGKIAGTFESLPGPAPQYELGLDTDVHKVYVKDTWANLDAQFKYTHPAGVTATICVAYYPDLKGGQLFPVRCSWTLGSLYSFVCCKDVGPTETGGSFGVVPFYYLWDGSGTWKITATARSVASSSGTQMCAPYTVDYSF